MKSLLVLLSLFFGVGVWNTYGQPVELVKGQALTEAASKVELVVDQDYSWAKHVSGVFSSAEYAQQRVENIAWKKTVDQAQADGKAGKYDEVIAKSPLSRQKAWATLNKLRTSMGGTLKDGNWSGYKADAKTGLFSGTAEEKTACVTLANSVKTLVKAAQDAGMDKDMSGLDVADASKWADHYLTNILK